MKVAERLEKIGVAAYCPARMEMRQRSDRKEKICVPLLPSIVLVNIDEREKSKVFDVQGVVRYLYWLEQPAKVSVDEVLTLKEVTEGKNSDALVLLTEWKEFRSPDFEEIRTQLKTPVIFDGRSQYNTFSLEKKGFEYYQIGKK